MDAAFLFLCKLAWAAKFRIPIIVAVAFMAFDIRMQVEINIHMRTIPRRHGIENGNDNLSDDSSWMTDSESSEEDDETEMNYVQG